MTRMSLMGFALMGIVITPTSFKPEFFLDAGATNLD
jgi:hypothetical protein